MFHQSSSRNPRSKGSNVKKILQVVVLLAVACWLLYQVKHSHDKRTEYSGNDDSKLSIGGPEIYLGRKGDAGSENVIIIDTSAQVSDESTEMKQGKVQQDGVNNEDKSKEGPQTHELEFSHANDEVETLHLPSEREGDNFSNQIQNSKEEGSTLEENGHLKENEKIEDIKSDLAVDDTVEATMNGEEGGTNSADQTDSSAGAGKDNEGISGEASNQDLSVDNESPKVEGVDSDGHSRSTSKNSDESKIDRAGDAHSDDDVSSSQSKIDRAGDKVDSQGDTTHEVEATGVQNAEASNEVSKEEEVEAQLGSVSEAENTESNPSGEIKTDSDSQNDAGKSVSNASDASSNVSVVSEENKASGTEVTTSANDVQENSSSLEANNNEIVEAEGNNDDAKVEKEESQRGDAVEAGHSENNFIDAKNDKETSEQIEKSSEGIEQGGADDPQQNITAGDAGEAQGTGDGKSEGNSDDAAGSDSVKEISGTEKQGGTVNEEEKNEAVLNDEATRTSEVNEKATSGDFTNENSTGEGVQAQGDENSAAESSNNSNNSNTGEAKIEENSNSEKEQASTSLNASSSEGESTEQKAAQ